MLSLGVCPDVTLKAAAERRDELRALLREGIDPGARRKREKTTQVALTANALEFVAREWHQLQTTKWSASHAERIMRRFEREVFPWLGKRDIASIEPPDVLAILRPLEKHGINETAHRVLESLGQVFRYAIAIGKATRNPCADLKGVRLPRCRRNTWRP